MVGLDLKAFPAYAQMAPTYVQMRDLSISPDQQMLLSYLSSIKQTQQQWDFLGLGFVLLLLS